MRSFLPALLAVLSWLAPSAFAEGFRAVQASPAAQCRAAIAIAERSGAIPDKLLAAIGRVESGRRDPETGRMAPWPWTINAEGQGFFYESKAEAIAAARMLQARGVRSMDVGCMQVNLMHHPDAFASLEQAFDPTANALYAARFLNQLHTQTNDWPRAAALYHSATPELGADYQRRVLAIWPEERQNGPAAQLAASVPGFGDGGMVSGRVAVALPPSRGETIRIIPLAGATGATPQGRGLDAYRAAPIAIASRIPGRSGG